MDTTSTNNKLLPLTDSFLSDIFMDVWEHLVFEFSLTKREFNKNYLKEIIKKNLTNIKKIWNSYTLDRSSLKSFAFNTPEYSLSYFIGFHVVNAVRIHQILNRIINRYHLDIDSTNINHINIFDIGCGTGAMSSSLLDFMLSYLIKSNLNIDKDISIKLNNLDRSSFFLKQAHTFNEKLFDRYSNLHTYNRRSVFLDIKDYKLSLENLGSSKLFQTIDKDSLNIFIVGYLYNEIVSKKKASSIFHSLFQKKHIKDSKSLVIMIDPANKTPCKNLMLFRDFIVKSNYTPLYPCPCLDLECPMIKTQDWCYSEFIFKQDNIQKFIDHSLKIDRSHLSASALCFVSKSLLSCITHNFSSSPIVVGKPIIKADKTQKHIQYLLCDGKKLFKKDPTNKNETIFLKGEEYKKKI